MPTAGLSIAEGLCLSTGDGLGYPTADGICLPAADDCLLGRGLFDDAGRCGCRLEVEWGDAAVQLGQRRAGHDSGAGGELSDRDAGHWRGARADPGNEAAGTHLELGLVELVEGIDEPPGVLLLLLGDVLAEEELGWRRGGGDVAVGDDESLELR